MDFSVPMASVDGDALVFSHKGKWTSYDRAPRR